MSVAFPEGMITLATPTGDIVIMRICDQCGAAVIEAEGTDLAFHKRWHRVTGSGSWVDPATGRMHGSSAARPGPFSG